MADIFTIAGATVDMNAFEAIPLRFSERFGGIPVLTLQRRGVALPSLPDPWMGKAVSWSNDASGTMTVRFVGDVVSVSPHYDSAIGWVLTYQCLGLRNRLDWFAHVDSNTGTFTSAFNLPLEDPQYNPTRAGRTTGQILAAVLTMPGVAVALNAVGVGSYTGLPSAPVLPPATVADLATMTIVPPKPIYFNGEKFGSGLDGFMGQVAPNFRPSIDPTTGTIRFLDLRALPRHRTLTMGSDPIEPTEISRDVGDCFQRVVTIGQPIACLAVLKQSQSDLSQNFAHDGLTNAAAIAAWTPAQFQQPGTAQDTGTCVCTSTTTITLTSSNAGTSWPNGYFDQLHQQGTVNFSGSTITGFTQHWTARVVTCPALSPGGSCTITIDSPLPSTAYDHYTLTGLATGGSVVWTQYQITNSAYWPRLTNQSTYPQAFISPGGGVTLTSSPMGAILFSDSGSPPYKVFPLPFTWNSATGNVRFLAPTYVIANNAAPADVWAAIPVVQNPNTATYPPDVAGVPQYAGTSHSVEGLARTLPINATYWRDPGQFAQIQAYAADLLDSVKDAVCEGAVVYYGLFSDAIAFGLSLSIAGNDGPGVYPTMGWDSLTLPVAGVSIEWPQGEGMSYKTALQLSNRKAHYSADMFMRPEQRFLALGTTDGLFNPYNIKQNVSGGLLNNGGMDRETGNAEGFNNLLQSGNYHSSNFGGYGAGGSLGTLGSTGAGQGQSSPSDYLGGIGTPGGAMAGARGPGDLGYRGITGQMLGGGFGPGGGQSATNPSDYFASQGIATNPYQFFGGSGSGGGGGGGQGGNDQANQPAQVAVPSPPADTKVHQARHSSAPTTNVAPPPPAQPVTQDDPNRDPRGHD